MPVVPMASLRDLSELLLLKTLPSYGSKTHILLAVYYFKHPFQFYHYTENLASQ